MDIAAIPRHVYCIVVASLLVAVCFLFWGCSASVGQQTGVIYQPRSEVFAEEDIEPYSAEEYEARGDAGFSRADLEFAFLNYSKALRLKPKNQGLRCKRAWVLLAGNFNDDAAEGFQAVLAKNNNSAAAREGLGQAYFQMKKYDHFHM